ncbi:MAG TPA: response regulator [Desulfocapsa sulfexigens]|nr:response regulator [Desulfocapsa sulfexigens]
MNITQEKPLSILAVDDNPTSLRLLESMLERNDFQVRTAVNGIEAMAILNQFHSELDIILLDRMMPEMDGVEVCNAMKKDEKLRYIPIIMQTAANRSEEIREGIEAGVFYYLTKPLNQEMLLSVVDAAGKQVRRHKQLRLEMERRKVSFGLVQILKCTFKTLEEAEGLSVFLANYFDDPDRTLTGISELLVNAVEHGNLGISYETKSELVTAKTWHKEISDRLIDPQYSERQVTVIFERKKDACYIQITDEGDGFDWKQYMEVDPSRAMHNHGRGIAMTNMLCFSKLVYNEKGNQVTGIVKAETKDEKDDFWG